MQSVKCVIRPEKLDEVKEVLRRLGVSGMTVLAVRGHGRQKGHSIHFRGSEYKVDLLQKIQIETVVPDEIADAVVSAIIKTARTGQVGDGRVFVTPVSECYKIRTGEREMS
jgi:nitrogen regulatory protein P-II 1